MNSTMLRSIQTMVVFLAACWLVACGSAPVMHHQNMMDANPSKISRVLFFYQEAELTSRQATGSAPQLGLASPAGINETGYAQFGEAMVAQAASAFQKHGVAVVHSAVVPPGQWQQFALKTFRELGPEARNGATMITVMPRGGYTSATNNSARIKLTFEVRVVDAASAKKIWNGSIDTSTWNGRDFLLKNVQGTKFDQAFADQFLESVMTTFRSNGLL